MKFLKREWLQLLILAAPFCAAALLWSQLPERIPTHWNIHGQVDAYGGKAFGTLALPVVNIFTVMLVWLISVIDPRVRKQDAEMRASSLKVFRGVRLTFSIFLTLVSLTILGIAIGLPLDMTRVICIGMSLLFLVLGNMMGKIRPNYFVGVRTPWTLESPVVWQKTHRFAGKVMVIGSLVMLAGGLLMPAKGFVFFFLPLLLLIAFVPVIYSFIVYKQQQPVP